MAVPQDLVFPDDAARAPRPGPGAPRPFHLPEVQTFTLASGAQVYLVELHVLPVVSLDLNYDGGAAVGPPGPDCL
jgi:predicted Zn-dependent peptidase